MLNNRQPVNPKLTQIQKQSKREISRFCGLAVLISVELYWMRLVGTQGDCCIVPVTMDYGLLME
eukprot:scaffold1887_cov267-Chaetoceros_neogracile.AAC.6